MRHAIVGAGGVGGFVGAALTRAGQDVVLILRPATLEVYPGGLEVDSQVLGEFDVDVPARSRLDREVDVIWMTVKAPQLGEAMNVAAAAVAPAAVVVPLLNGIDHVGRLRSVYGDAIIPGSIRIESERVAPGRVFQSSPFAAVELGPPPGLHDRARAIATELEAAGLSCIVRDSEAAVLWGKLALLAPLALGTTAVDGDLSAARDDPEVGDLMLRAAREVTRVAATQGADVDAESLVASLRRLPPQMRSSLQKDVAAGRPDELDAIAGPVLRIGAERGVPTPAVAELVRRIGARKAV